MSKKLNLTQGKWYTNLLGEIIGLIESKCAMDFKDSYRFRNSISESNCQIKTLLPILRDVDAILPNDREDVYLILKNLFNNGRWDKSFYELVDKITHHFEMNFTCEFCGIYRAIKPKCNKCDREF